MNIAYVCVDRGIPLLGTKGASVHVRAITTALAARGHQVHVCCARLGDGNRALEGVGSRRPLRGWARRPFARRV